MGTFSDGAKDAMLNAQLRGVVLDNDGGVWIKLHVGDPGAAGTANPAANTDRMQVTLAAPGAGGGGREVVSSDAVEWLAVPNAETYSWVSFWDDESAGNFLGKDDLPTPQAVQVGNTFRIPSGDVALGISDS